MPIPVNPFTGQPFAYHLDGDTAVLQTGGPEKSRPREFRIKLADQPPGSVGHPRKRPVRIALPHSTSVANGMALFFPAIVEHGEISISVPLYMTFRSWVPCHQSRPH